MGHMPYDPQIQACKKEKYWKTQKEIRKYPLKSEQAKCLNPQNEEEHLYINDYNMVNLTAELKNSDNVKNSIYLS